MKKFASIFAMFTLLMVFGAGNAFAWSFDISAISNDGSTVVYAVSVADAAAVNISNFDLDISWDATELAFVSSSDWMGIASGGPPPVWYSHDWAYIYAPLTTLPNNIAYNAGNIAAATNSQQICLLTFDILAGAIQDGENDIFWTDDGVGDNGYGSEAGFQYFADIQDNLTVVGGDVGEPGGDVPIPGAVYLLASGLIGLVGLRRKMA